MSDVCEKNVEKRGRPFEKGNSGRPAGSLNKTTALLKDAILLAAEKAGGSGGLVGYLQAQAKKNPTAFLSLLGKVLPLQISSLEKEVEARPEITDRQRAQALVYWMAKAKAKKEEAEKAALDKRSSG